MLNAHELKALKIQVAYGGGDLQEQRGPFEACGSAAYRGWVVRFARKMGFVPGALFFCFVFFWACKRK